MEKQDILKICVKNGFFLDVNMLNFFIKFEKKEIINIIEGLKSFGCSEKILTKDVFEKYKDKIRFPQKYNKESINNLEILNNNNIKCKKVDINCFINCFRDRFEKIRDILIKNNPDKFISIRRIGNNNGVFWFVGMVYSKRITKNKNLLIEFEDLTGRIIVLINRDNKKLFERAKNLLLDDIVALKCSGSSKILFGIDFIYPGANLNVEKYGNSDEFVAFVSDFHVGSNNFLEKELMRFVFWINGEIGTKEQRNLAGKIKYLLLVGNNVDGVGVYPNQEKLLDIKECINQYDKLAKILGLIRKDVEIIMCPGFYDAVWIGEPQPIILEKWSGELNKLSNLRMIPNPSLVKISDLRFLIYSGGNLNKFIDEMPMFRKKKENFDINIIKEILKRRHLAPVYGKMDILLNKNEDELVLDILPDVFVVGGQEYATFKNYNNILMISTSSWQSKLGFKKEDKINENLCKVPVLNLKTKNIKILDFSNNKIKGNKL